MPGLIPRFLRKNSLHPGVSGCPQLGNDRPHDRRPRNPRSRVVSLLPNIVEKDYVLGWMLAGINAHGELNESWVFKGGTCLKKCYFETYRFSECAMKHTSTRNSCGRLSKKSSPG